MRHPITVVLAICLTVIIEMRPAAQTSGTALPIFVDYDAPPAEVGALASVADAIVVVRIEAVRYESVPDMTTGRLRDVTRYDVRVMDTIKPYSTLPDNQGAFTLTRIGGQHNENGRLVRSVEEGFENFERNGEYLLFLTWNARRREFDIAYGPNGAYQLVPSGAVRPLGKAGVAAKQQGKKTAALLSELRIASGR